MMDTSEAVRTLGFDSASQPQHYLDMPTGGRIKIAVASSNRSNPDARVTSIMASGRCGRAMRR